MNRFLLAIYIVFSFIISAKSQQKSTGGSVSGLVVEQTTGEPLQFVNVALYHNGDSILIQGMATNKSGEFKMTNISTGSFYLGVSLIGFETFKSPAFSIRTNNEEIKMDTIPLVESATLLNELKVTEDKSIYETTLDRKIYNVDKELMRKAGSASDILGNVPSVSVDIDGTVSLRGSSNVTIFINGKPSPLMKINSAEALQQIPANTIERIEIITNPSAKFRPDGTAGIINLVLKKEKNSGLNGSLTINAGNDSRYNSNLTFNYKPGKVNLFGGYGFRQDDRIRSTNDYRRLFDSIQNSVSYYEQNSYADYRPISHMANAGLDYLYNDKNEIGISGNYFYMGFLRNENATTVLQDEGNKVTGDFSRDRIDNEYESEKSLSAHFNHKFKKEDNTLQFELTLSDQFEQEDNRFTERHRIPAYPDAYNNTLIKQGEKQAQITAEYALPINEESEFEAGYSGEFIQQDLDFYGEFYDLNQDNWIKDMQKSNRFLLDQKVHAIYGTYSHIYNAFSFLAGLRAEQAYITSNLVNLDSIIQNNYFKLYPTIHLTYKWNEKEEFKLSYSKRINRPEGDELNPFPEYADPRNPRAGNPYLNPEQIHSLELGYHLQNSYLSFMPTLYYRYKYDAFTQIKKYINDSTLLTTFENMASEKSAGLEIVLSGNIKKFMYFNFSSNVFYDQIDASNLGYSPNKSVISWNAKIGINMDLSRSTTMQVNANYRSSQLTPQGKFLPVFVLNTGLRQDIFKNRASIILTASDVFNTLRASSEINTPEFYQKLIRYRKSQIIYIGLTWRFGKTNKKGKEDLKFDENL